MKKSVAILTLVLATAAFAQEQKTRTRPDQPVERSAAKKREAAPLLYVLPALGTKEAVTLEIRLLEGKRQLVSEVVKLPANVAEGAAVDVLFTHPDQLQRLRAIEAEKAGSLRFIGRVQGRVVTDEPFAAVEARGATLSPESAVGEIWQVEVRPSPKLLTRAQGVYKDPACTDQCDVMLNSCLEWCDPRGDSCTQCYIWYNDCWSQCGDICEEPKSTSTHTVATFYSAFPYGNGCYAGTQWTHWSQRYLISVYQRTTHCDNSYTDTFQYSYYQDTDCWSNDYYTCSPSNGPAPINRCP